MGCAIEDNETFFVLPREMIVEYAGTEMPIWQRKLFGALSRAGTAYNYILPSHLNLPGTACRPGRQKPMRAAR
jgi:hypothetical protein